MKRASRDYELVETFVEAGASATNDRRPEFQRMIEAGTAKPPAFDVMGSQLLAFLPRPFRA